MMHTVITRDPQSTVYAQTLGRTVDATSTDVVFALAPPSRTENRDIILNISGLLWFENDHVDSTRYRTELVDLVAALRDRGRQVSLLAHVVNNERSNDDDRSAIRAFQRETGVELETIIPRTLEEVRSVVAGANLVIGARMHACLNALSCGTPAVAWAYSRKFAPLMSDLGWEFVVDLANPKSNPMAETLRFIDSFSQAEFDQRVLSVQQHAQQRLAAAVSALSRVVE